MTKHIKAATVAKWFLKQGSTVHFGNICNLKLQKLVYYAQAWHLAFFGKKLFEDRIEAWIHGPAVRPLYGMYKEFGFNPIPYIGGANDSDFSPSQLSLLKEVWNIYGKYDGAFLEALTHSELPWQQARVGLDAGDPSRREITPESMRAFYASKVSHSTAKSK